MFCWNFNKFFLFSVIHDSFQYIKTALKAAIGCYSLFLILTMIMINNRNFSQILPSLDLIFCLLVPVIFYVLHFSDGRIRFFLSHKIWSPLSKMCLSIYLMSGYVQFGFHKRQQEPLVIEGLTDWVRIPIKSFSSFQL